MKKITLIRCGAVAKGFITGNRTAAVALYLLASYSLFVCPAEATPITFNFSALVTSVTVDDPTSIVLIMKVE